ncbi:MAG: hypothetical protein ABI479_08695, partial [Gallionella sp.]
ETNQHFVAECILGWICDSNITTFRPVRRNSRVSGLFLSRAVLFVRNNRGLIALIILIIV